MPPLVTISILPSARRSAKRIRMNVLPPRSALYLPASNPRAIEKARSLPADLIMLDLEDSVKPEMKDIGRRAAVEASTAGFDGRLCAVRMNGLGSPWCDMDVTAISTSKADYVVVPKIEDAMTAAELVRGLGKPLLVMIETPVGVLNAATVARVPGVAGLIAGTNDLANALHIPPGSGRCGLALSLQMIVLAARAADIWALDGVYNDLRNVDAFASECAEGRAMGFDGKTLIHPNQIDTANRAWSPSVSQIEDARALIAAASGGAERFRDRMIETMHVEMAHRLLARAPVP
jgi:(3S)-malyl-CoA thioesterase